MDIKKMASTGWNISSAAIPGLKVIDEINQ
jgi:hypothetical protein